MPQLTELQCQRVCSSGSRGLGNEGGRGGWGADLLRQQALLHAARGKTDGAADLLLLPPLLALLLRHRVAARHQH